MIKTVGQLFQQHGGRQVADQTAQQQAEQDDGANSGNLALENLAHSHDKAVGDHLFNGKIIGNQNGFHA